MVVFSDYPGHSSDNIRPLSEDQEDPLEPLRAVRRAGCLHEQRHSVAVVGQTG